jgi:hypothetical protein
MSLKHLIVPKRKKLLKTKAKAKPDNYNDGESPRDRGAK